MMSSASRMMRSISSLTVGTSWISPATMPQRPGARVHVAVQHDARIDAGHFLDDVLELEVAAERLLLLEQPVDRGVAQHAFGVAQRPHHESRVELGRGDDRLLDVLVHRRLLRRDEARAHVDAFGAERERSDQRSAVRHAAGCDERDLQLLGCARQQDEVRHVVLAGMTAALEAVDADGVAADRLCLQRVAHRRALVDHLDAGGVQVRHHLLGVAAGRLDDLDAALDDRADVAGIVRRIDRRQERQVHADRLVGHVAAAADLFREGLRRLLRQAGDDAEPARVRHGGGQFGEADVVHAALDDRVLDAEEFGDAGLHGVLRRSVRRPGTPVAWTGRSRRFG